MDTSDNILTRNSTLKFQNISKNGLLIKKSSDFKEQVFWTLFLMFFANKILLLWGLVSCAMKHFLSPSATHLYSDSTTSISCIKSWQVNIWIQNNFCQTELFQVYSLIMHLGLCLKAIIDSILWLMLLLWGLLISCDGLYKSREKLLTVPWSDDCSSTSDMNADSSDFEMNFHKCQQAQIYHMLSPINTSERQGLSWLCDSCCSFFYSRSEKHGCSNVVMKQAETCIEIYYDDLVKIVKWLLTIMAVLALVINMNVKHISHIYNMWTFI